MATEPEIAQRNPAAAERVRMRIDASRNATSCHRAPSTTTPANPHEPFSKVLRPQVRTPMSEQEAFDRLASAWERVHGQPPSQKTVAILWAQWAMETGRGKSMYGYNFSGIKGTGPSGLSLMLRTHEGYGATREAIRDRFRAYVGPEEGATDYIRLLRDRYPDATQAAKDGDPTRFVREIRRRGYFTDAEAKYTRAVTSLANEALGKQRAVEPARDERVPRVSPASATSAAQALCWTAAWLRDSC